MKRTIEKAEDNSYYSTDAVTLIYEEEEKNTFFFIDPNVLYSQVHNKLEELSGAKIVLTEDEEQNKLKKRMVSLIRACIKGGLIVWGYDLLTLLLGSKQHDKPNRKDDIVDWYMDQFTKIAIATMMKSDIILQGITEENNEVQSIVAVHRCFTRPITEKSGTGTSTELTNNRI